MDLRFDDFDLIDMIESIDLVKVAPDGTETTYSAVQAYAEQEVPAMPTDAGGVQMTPATRNWHVRTSSLPPGVVPARGDKILSTSDWVGGTWVIKSSKRVAWGVRFECDTQLLED